MLTKVDNNARGNCMYEAYSISLMYYLLNQRDPALAEKIFNKLELDPESKKRLSDLLNNKQLTDFNLEQLKDPIQSILGPATRKIAAESIKFYFNQKPVDSSLFTSTNYGITCCFRNKFRSENNHEFTKILKDFDYTNQDYTNAEIYRKFGIGSKEFMDHINQHHTKIIDSFNQKWPDRVAEMYQVKLSEFKENIQKDYGTHQEFIKSLLESQKLDLSTLSKNLKFSWDVFLTQKHNECGKTKNIDSFANDIKFQLEFIRKIYPKEPFTFEDALKECSEEWDEYIKQKAAENNVTILEISTNKVYQFAFRNKMESKCRIKCTDIIRDHKKEWGSTVEAILSKQNMVKKEKINEDDFYKKELLTELIQEVTIDFFKKDDNKHLNAYRDYLNTDLLWGTEDTILSLHQYIQGWKNVEVEKDKWIQKYDIDIPMEIYVHNAPKAGTKHPNPEMILNHNGTNHWYSLIPPKSPAVTNSKNPKTEPSTDPLSSSRTIDEQKKDGEEFIKKLNNTIDAINEKISQCLNDLESKIGGVTNNVNRTTFNTAKNLLTTLNNLKEAYIAELIAIREEYKDAEKEGKNISENYFTKKKQDPDKQFIAQTKKEIIKAIPKLQENLGWGDYLKNFFQKIYNLIMKCANNFSTNPNGFFPLRTLKISDSVNAVRQTINNDLPKSIQLEYN